MKLKQKASMTNAPSECLCNIQLFFNHTDQKYDYFFTIKSRKYLQISRQRNASHV